MRDGDEHPAPDATARERFTFASLVEPLGIDAFFGDHHGKREWFQRGRHDRFDGLLSWQTLNALIRDQRPTAPRFRLTKADRLVPEAAYHRIVQTLRGPLRLLEPARMLAELRAGATLVWDAIDQAHPPIREVKQAIERALHAFAFVNMYASWGTVAGVGAHWDDHDVFVLQITGRKRWRVHPATRKHPLPEDFDEAEPPGEYAYEWTLAAGDVLYLPRGWWHQVSPQGEPSLHLTVGILRPTNADVLGWLLERAKESELVRQDFPFPMDDEARASHAAALRSALEAWIQPATLALYEQVHDATHYLDPRPTLQAVADARAEAWDPEAAVVCLSTRASVEDRDTNVALVVTGREWLAPGAAAPLLRELVDGRAVRLGTLLERVPAQLVSALVTAGVLAVT
jgi:ribosomal protein L16 Arg81 hydroxylase